MREKLIYVMKDTRANAAWHHWGYEESADHLIANDVVHVVRCKDCKHYVWAQEPCHGRTQYVCRLHKGLVVVNTDTFCSYGERKDNA